MSRTTADAAGAPKIPNMTAMSVPSQIRPPGVAGPSGPVDQPGQGRMESGGTSVQNMREVTLSEVLTTGEYKGSAVTAHNLDKDIHSRRYRVTKAGTFRIAGNPQHHTMHEGKVVDDANYNIRAMVAQGIKLVEIDQDDNELPARK